MIYSFGTLNPSPNLLQNDGALGNTGGGSPNPVGPADDPSSSGNLSTELEQLIIENNDLMDLDVPLRNRYSGLEENVESLILDYTAELVLKKSPDIPRNLLRSLSSTCGLR